MKVVPNHNWESYHYNTDNCLVVVGFHTEANKIDRDKYPHCARVIITVKRPNANGGPAQDEAEVLWAMEDELTELLEKHDVSCLMLGRLTHAGVRELIFQVADWATFRPPVGRWMQLHQDYNTDVSEHDGWDFFFNSVWPSEQSWMFIHDRRVIDNLIRSRSSPEKLHSLEYVFRGASEELQKLQQTLDARGYKLVDFTPAEQRLVMAKSFPLHIGPIFSESVALHEECGQLGIEFDGWGCLVVN